MGESSVARVWVIAVAAAVVGCGKDCGRKACPDERMCAGQCCATGTQCVSGRCSGPGADGGVTVDAGLVQDARAGDGGGSAGQRPAVADMEAAAAALAAGGTDVPITADGSWRYRRTVTGGVRTSDRLVVQGRELLIYEHSGSRSTGKEDADGDGFFEWRIEATRGASATQGSVQITRYTPSTDSPTERTTYTRQADKVTVAVEQYDATASALKKVREFTKPLETDQQPQPTVAQGTCTPAECDPAALKAKLRQAADQGLVCLHSKGATDLEMRLTAAYINNKIEMHCEKLGTRLGRTRLATTLNPLPFPLDLDPHVSISVNEDAFCALAPPDQLAILFHELTHLDDPSHVPEQETAPNRADVDRMYACQDLCFKPPSSVTQCACATCLNTTKCDSRCDAKLGFQTCPDDLGAWCPCPTRLQWYPSCSSCLAGCPSGLGCFGFSFCVPVNKGLCTPRTCP